MTAKEYYAFIGVDLERLIKIGQEKKLDEWVVHQGAELLYVKIKDGMNVNRLAVGPRILAEAKLLSRTDGLTKIYNRLIIMNSKIEDIQHRVNLWKRFAKFMTKKRYIKWRHITRSLRRQAS